MLGWTNRNRIVGRRKKLWIYAGAAITENDCLPERSSLAHRTNFMIVILSHFISSANICPGIPGYSTVARLGWMWYKVE